MNRDETIDLLQKCQKARASAFKAGKSDEVAHEQARKVWNDWAHEIVAQRKLLEEAGDWQIKTDSNNHVAGTNDATKSWLNIATLDFSGLRFDVSTEFQPPTTDNDGTTKVFFVSREKKIDLSRLLFPSPVKFDHTDFLYVTTFEKSEFHFLTCFDECTFRQNISFKSVIAKSHFSAKNTKFRSEALFHDSCFSGNVHFDRASFDKDACFNDTHFEATISFNSAQFQQLVLFEA